MQQPRQVGAVAPNRPSAGHSIALHRPVRKQLDHSVHFHGRFGATYFITICCEQRGANQLCKPDVAEALFETARRYHESERWYLELLLLMPDHLHMLIGICRDAQISSLVKDFKRITSRVTRVKWQRNFFDHRVRADERDTEKFDYIRHNPVRAGLVRHVDEWPYFVVGEDR